LSYALSKSVLAACVIPSPAWFVPFTVPGGNPVIVVVGYDPIPPSITVAPVLVIAEPARTPKLAAVPSDGAVAVAIIGLASPPPA
jgi:hypothetical protein